MMGTQYTYETMPADVMPPIGSNHLMHLFEHPEHAEVIPVLYRKIPKTLRARLVACPRKGSSVGWGLQFVEGMNWFVVFLQLFRLRAVAGRGCRLDGGYGRCPGRIFHRQFYDCLPAVLWWDREGRDPCLAIHV